MALLDIEKLTKEFREKLESGYFDEECPLSEEEMFNLLHALSDNKEGRMIDFDTINPGDVIECYDGEKGIVTKVTPNKIEFMYSDGSADFLKEEHLQYWTYAGDRKELLSKLLSL